MKHIGQFVREIIPVITGILIALFINDWNDKRKDKAYLDRMFSSMQQEFEESIGEIERAIPRQKAFADSLGVDLDNDELNLYDIMMKAGGIYTPAIKTNSWNAIANSKIELIEYDRLSELAGIEEWKENLHMRNDRLMDFLFANFEETDRAKKKMLRMMIQDIARSEARLKSNFEELLQELKNEE